MNDIDSKKYSKKLGVMSAFVFLALTFGPSFMTAFYDTIGDYQLAMEKFLVMEAVGTASIHFGPRTAKKREVQDEAIF